MQLYCVDAVILKSIVVIIGFPVVLGIGQKHNSIYNDPQLLHCKKKQDCFNRAWLPQLQLESIISRVICTLF